MHVGNEQARRKDTSNQWWRQFVRDGKGSDNTEKDGLLELDWFCRISLTSDVSLKRLIRRRFLVAVFCLFVWNFFGWKTKMYQTVSSVQRTILHFSQKNDDQLILRAEVVNSAYCLRPTYMLNSRSKEITVVALLFWGWNNNTSAKSKIE